MLRIGRYAWLNTVVPVDLSKPEAVAMQRVTVHPPVGEGRMPPGRSCILLPRFQPPGTTQDLTRITSSVRGPCTPLMRVISMSEVAEGPEIVVNGAVPKVASWRIPSGTVCTTWSA